MITHIYFSKVFTATATGRRLKDVTCEKCNTPFCYPLDRAGAGRASAPYYLFQARAKARAEKSANNDLAKRLDRDQELVPCPACKWVNDSAIRHYRKTRHRNLFVGAMALLGLAAITDAILVGQYPTIFLKPFTWTAPEPWIVAAAALALAGALLLLQTLLRRRINPNRSSNGHPKVPVGTPPAILRGPDGQPLDVIPSDTSNLQTDATWAHFRAGQLFFPPLCCNCLDTATTAYKLPMTLQKTLPVPLCDPCLRHMRRGFWLKNLAMLPLPFALAWLATLPMRQLDDVGKCIMITLLGGLLALVGFAIIDWCLQPYRMRHVDKDRAVWKIAFKNPAYTALLLRQLGQADGLYATTTTTPAPQADAHPNLPV